MNPKGDTLPRYQNWTFSVERQITNSMVLDVAYVANHGTRLISGPNMNDLNQNNPAILQQYPASVLSATVGTPAANGFPAPYAGFHRYGRASPSALSSISIGPAIQRSERLEHLQLAPDDP